MTAPDPHRRRFLVGVAGAAGLAIAAVFGLRRGPDSTTAGPASTSTPSTTSTTEIPPTTGITRAPASPSPTTTTTGVTSPPTTTSEVPAAIAVAAICRDAWGAKPVGGELTPHTIERLTVHHTAAALTDNRRAPAQIRGHQDYHMGLGWPDLAYHFVIDAAGNVYEGRPVDAVGDTGTEYDPTGHFLVCCEGDFDAHDVPDAQRAALVGVLAWAATTYGVGVETIAGHRDYASTSCPGEALYPAIASGELARAVAARMDAGGMELTVPCDDAAFARVAAIEAGTGGPAD
jgi:hypothetical protein